MGKDLGSRLVSSESWIQGPESWQAA